MAEVEAGAQESANPQEKQEQEPKQAPRTYSQEEVDRIADKVRKNARRDAELRFRREQEARSPQQPRQDEPPQKKDDDPEPKREEYEHYESYQRAVAGWEARKASREERQKEREEESRRLQREEQEKAERTWGEKIQRAKAKYQDFEDVVGDYADGDSRRAMEIMSRSPGIRAATAESDIGPELIYHLAKNLPEVERIAALPRYKQAAEIAKLEESLSAPEKKEGGEEPPEKNDDDPEREQPDRGADGRFKPNKEPSKAPAPINPVGTRGTNPSADPQDRDDDQTWFKKRHAQVERRRKGT